MNKFIKSTILLISTLFFFSSTILKAQSPFNMNTTATVVGTTATIDWLAVPNAIYYHVLITETNLNQTVVDQNVTSSPFLVNLTSGNYTAKITPIGSNYQTLKNVINDQVSFSIIIDEVVFITIDDCKIECNGVQPTYLTNDPLRLVTPNGTSTLHYLILNNPQDGSTIPIKLDISRVCNEQNTCTVYACNGKGEVKENSVSLYGSFDITMTIDFTQNDYTEVTILANIPLQYTSCKMLQSKCKEFEADDSYEDEKVMPKKSQQISNIATTVSPNPFTETLNINYNNDVIDNNLNLSIFNIQGQLIKSTQESNLSLGENNITFDMQDTPKGLYFLKITDTQNTQKIFKLTKM